MKCTISCSVGEIIDKITILKIKKKKATDASAIKNITHELNTIELQLPLSKNEDPLFEKLYEINNKLWVLEDLIRKKSRNKEYDKNFINYAESIHETNDERYNIKKKINIKYKSDIIEEKIYKNNFNDILSTDKQLLEKCKYLYTIGDYNQCLSMLNKLVNDYKDYQTNNQFIIDLLISYSNICNIFNINYEFIDKLNLISKNIDKLNLSIEFKNFFKTIYNLICLRNNEYKESYKYLYLLNTVKGPGILPENMSYFKRNDINKVLLIYNGGGIGDIIMFIRFLPLACNSNKNNKIIIMIEDKLIWILKECFSKFDNLSIISYSQRNNIPKYDYHCNIHMLMKYLEYSYNNIFFTPYLSCIKSPINKKNENLISEIKNSNNKFIVLNWHGSYNNAHEKSNRGMNLENAIPLFKLENITWLVVTKEISNYEYKILNKHNVIILNKYFDNSNNSFEDTITLFKHVDYVISTDTSILHISGSMDVPTIALLTLGCDWRWNLKGESTNWYPNMKLIKQKTYGDWKYVINNVIDLIK